MNWAAGTDPVPASLPDPRTKAGLPLGPQCVCASRWRALAPSTHCLPDCSLGAGWQVSSMLRAPPAVVCVQTLRREMYGDPKVEFDFGSQNFSSLFWKPWPRPDGKVGPRLRNVLEAPSEGGRRSGGLGGQDRWRARSTQNRQVINHESIARRAPQAPSERHRWQQSPGRPSRQFRPPPPSPSPACT